MPRVSVVVPIYNVEHYLEECLESLAAQTFQDLEVVRCPHRNIYYFPTLPKSASRPISTQNQNVPLPEKT